MAEATAGPALERMQVRPLSSLEKCFMDEDLSEHPVCDRFTMFRNERLSFQIGIYNPTTEEQRRALFLIATPKGALAKYTTVRQVISVANQYPDSYPGYDDNLLRNTVGLYPDPIRPLHYNGAFAIPPRQTVALWLDIELPADYPAGESTLTVELAYSTRGQVHPSPLTEERLAVPVTVTVLDAELPPQKLIHTEWFYTDCIANVNHQKAFSEAHWRAIESYLRVATANGINMILTPVFTPELDTYIGGERLTTQLTDITVVGKDRYTFNFSKLDRWIALCKDCGVEYYEIPHFFTQWGAKAAPKFVAKVNGRTRRIFGWETDSKGPEYRAFLAQFIPALLDALKRNGVDRQCFFHVSDEPSLKALEQYNACREILSEHLKDYPIIDALSDYDFYATGALKKPVPAIGHIAPFLENKVPGLWTYYCGNKAGETGRMLAMPAARTRILGVQLWLNRIEGFLHWGYNFYNNCHSFNAIHPMMDAGGEFFAPAGDAFLVYPDVDGTALESIRLNAMREAMVDMRMLDLVEERRGRDFAEQLVTEAAGGTPVTFSQFPTDADFFLRLRAAAVQALQ